MQPAPTGRIPPGLAEICRRGLDPDPARRPADAGEMAGLLEKQLRRRPSWIVMAAVVAGIVLAILLAWLVLH